MIVAFDPGVTTGVAWWDGSFHADQFDEETLDYWLELHAASFEHVRVEQFVITQATAKKGRVYESLYVIGVLRYMSRRHGFEISWTKPADVMSTFPDVALKRAKMHTPGKVHANDAARHLAHLLVRSGTLSGSVFLPR